MAASLLVVIAVSGAEGLRFDFPVGQRVPDGEASGLAVLGTVSGVPEGSALSVGLTLDGVGAGMLNGDIFASLSHENALGEVDAYVVLLNRPGKRAEDDEGYRDNGFDVVFGSDPGLPDVHSYRLAITGDHAIPLGTSLGGFWAPDRRERDPDDVLDTDPRGRGLDDFLDIEPSEGRWVLYVADLLGGGEARLAGWSLSFVPVPEPISGCVVIGLALGGWVLARRSRRERKA